MQKPTPCAGGARTLPHTSDHEDDRLKLPGVEDMTQTVKFHIAKV